jgi:hypothetical protein
MHITMGANTIDVGLIRTKAYLLWEQAGCPEGRSQEFWLAAEHELVEPTPAMTVESSKAATRDSNSRKPT